MITIDEDKGLVVVERREGNKVYGIGTPEAFSLISKIWLRSGWDTKYVYSFTWLGRPVIQLPEDLIRVQEVIYQVKPDVIIETGVAHGGTIVFYATLFKAMNKGRVIGIDVEIRPHNRKAIEAHELSGYITLIEGDSVASETVELVRKNIKPHEKCLVALDSNHTKQHVLAELEAYSSFVSVGSYIISEDGIMETLVGAPRTEEDWGWNNPKAAAEEFVKKNNSFVIDEPPFLFNEGLITERITYWPSAFLKRIK